MGLIYFRGLVSSSVFQSGTQEKVDMNYVQSRKQFYSFVKQTNLIPEKFLRCDYQKGWMEYIIEAQFVHNTC